VHWGWTHSYDLSVATSAATHIDLRRATVASLAPQIIMAQYLLDTASQLPTAKDIALRAAAAAGTARHLHDSVRLVSLGGRRIEFARLPDGSFMPTSSILATLTMAGDSSHALEFRHGNTISFRAEDGRATSIVDRYGQTMNLGYTDEKLTTVTDRFARGLTFAYLGDNLSTVTDSTGRVVSYALNGSSLTISGPDGYAMTFETDGAGHITRVLDAYARPIVENDYDAFGRVFQQRPLGDPAKQSELGYAPWTARETFADGFSDWTRFDPRYRRTSYEDGAGNVTRWSFDGWDRITSLTTPRDGVWEWGYDAYHVLTSEKDPVGQTRTIIPNSAHLPETIHDFKGNATIVTYTPQFRIDTITTAGGLLTDLDYDPTGLITALKPPAAEIATGFGNFDAHGNPQTITHPVGGTSSMTYNALGDVTQSIDRLQATTSFEYNNRRQLTATKRWFNQADPTSDAYDVQAVDLTAYANTGAVDFEVVGRLVRISDGSIIEEGLITNYVTDALDYVLEVQKGAALVPVLKNTYNDRNQLWQTHDANDALTEFGYDAAGRLIWSRDPRQNTTNYGYDADSNLTTTTTPLQSVFTSSFDLAGRLHTWTDALDRVVTYGRDPNGRTESLLNRRGKAYGWIYDDVNRVMTRSTPTGKTVTMTLNVRGLVESIVEASTQTTTFTEFDAEGRPTAMVDGVGNVTYNYWENGLPREITETVDGTPRTSLRIHDKLNRLHEYHDGEGNTLRYTYYPTDLLRSITYPDGTSQVTYVYDDFGRLHTVTDWAGRVTTYHWDNASRLMQVDRPNGTKRVMTYTVDNRLESINELGSNDSPIWQSEFTIIDEDGLIKQRSLVPLLSEAPLPVDAMVFDDDNRVSSFEALTVVHDDDGNMTSGPDQAGAPMTYVYDARNRLTMAGPMIYRYATDGQLAESNEGGVVSSYVVDPNTALSRTLVRTKNGQTTFYVYGLGLLYEDTAGATVTCHYDHMGSTVALSATDGVTLLDQLQYAAYGTIVGRTGAYDTPFLLHGETGVMTDTSGLNYMRARFYHPRMMRFINADPIEFSGGLNWYAAFGNNPMSLFDPWGFKDAPNSADERTIIEIPLATGMQRAAVEAEVLALRVALGAADIFGQIFGGEINQQWVDELVFRTRISQGVLPNSVGASVIDEGTDVAQIVGGAVLSGGKRPPSLSPHGAGRKGAFRQAKRDAGVPVGNQPSRVLPNINRQGKVVPGRVYEFDIPTEGGGTMTIRIRDDAAGHDFGVGDPQNRGPHFNGPVDAAGNSTHYDYP
jgi:RHS repeat-associated protein